MSNLIFLVYYINKTLGLLKMTKTSITQHMRLTQNDRQSHIDLTTQCYGYVIKQGKRKGQWSNNCRIAKNSLLDFLQIEDFRSYKFHTCHLCSNHSQAPNGFVCINPRHLYFGTVKENHNDLDPNGNPTGGKLGGKEPASEKQKKAASKTGYKTQKKLMKEGRHANQQLHTCPHCNFKGKGGVMKRWHFDNCKLKQ